jgi:hypothetical protein
MKRDMPALAVLAFIAWLSLGAAEPARDAAPPPSPPFRPAPHALFADDFSSDTLGGWRSDSLASVWSIRGGMLRGELPDVKQAHAFLFAGDSTWTDYAVDVDVCGMRGVDKGLAMRVRGKKGLGVDLRGGDHQDVLLYCAQFPDGSGKAANTNGTWRHMRVEIRGSACRVIVDDHVVIDKHLRFKPPKSGGIVLAAYAGGAGQCTVYYDNVVVTSLAAGTAPAP